MPNGVRPDKWTPSGSAKFFKLSLILSPLDAVKEHLTVISGLTHKPSHKGDGHYYKTASWLSTQDVLYVIENGSDLVHWEAADLIGRAGEPLHWSRDLISEDPDVAGESLPRCLYRIRTIEGVPNEGTAGFPLDRE